MQGFRKLVIVGVLLVTLLIVIETIDARNSNSKQKEIDSKRGNRKEGYKISKAERITDHDKIKAANRYKRSMNSEEEFSESEKSGENKYKGKKGAKENKDENTIPKITKTYQKVKKYKVVEDGPAEKFVKSKKTSKSQKYKEKASEMNKTVKKSPSKVFKEKEIIEDSVNEELYKLYGVDNIFEEDENASNLKRKKYKLVEVVLEEDKEESQEGNETILEVDSEDDLSGIKRTESEEVIEKFRTTETLKLSKSKQSLEENDEEAVDEEDESNLSASSDYNSELDVSDHSTYSEDHSSRNEEEYYSGCRPLPNDPNRKGPKKLIIYVHEEEVNGKIEKYVEEVEDGVTVCEVADLLQKKYGG